MFTLRLGILAALLPAALSAQVIGGLVVDSATQQPIAGAKVTVLDADSSSAVAETVTDSTGVFYVQLRRAGAYRLKFDVVPTTLAFADTLVLGANDFVERKFVLALPANPVYNDSQVTKPVAIKPGTTRLRYPDELRRRNVEGSVLVTYVVGLDGRVERESIRILTSSDAKFSTAVLDALVGAEFTPAEVRGKPVRQWVQQPFNFTLTSGSGPGLFILRIP